MVRAVMPHFAKEALSMIDYKSEEFAAIGEKIYADHSLLLLVVGTAEHLVWRDWVSKTYVQYVNEQHSDWTLKEAKDGWTAFMAAWDANPDMVPFPHQGKVRSFESVDTLLDALEGHFGPIH
jgi:hypothetical protein